MCEHSSSYKIQQHRVVQSRGWRVALSPQLQLRIVKVRYYIENIIICLFIFQIYYITVDIALYLTDVPKQPRIKFPTTKFGEKLRSFNPDWYMTHNWLEYYVNRDAAYCFPCRFSSRLNLPDAPLTKIGFRDWKHATGQNGRLIEHRKSMAHVEAVHTWEEYKLNLQRGTTINQSLDKIGMNVIKENCHF